MHWMDPHSRGVYHHPHSAPPTPMSHSANDIGSRLARLEEHIRFAGWDRQRVEIESRMRAGEMLEAVKAIHGRMDTIEATQQAAATETERPSLLGALISGTLLLSFAKYAVLALLMVALFTGRANVNDIAPLIKALLGFPSG